MGYLGLRPEPWSEVVRRVGEVGAVRWAWSALRDDDGAYKLAVLRVSAETLPKPRTLDYGDLIMATEALTPAEAARRLSMGVTTDRGDLADALKFEVPTWEVRPHRRTTGNGPSVARTGWPEYYLNHDATRGATTGRQLNAVNDLVREGLPVYADGKEAVAEFVYCAPLSEPNMESCGHVVVSLPDQQGRIAALDYRGRSVRVRLEGRLDGCVLRASWRPTSESVHLEQAAVPKPPSHVRLPTRTLPYAMSLYLTDEDDRVVDTRGWTGNYGDRPEDTTFGRDQIRRLLREGEDTTVEFKQALKEAKTSASLAGTVAAFANGQGGTVLLGVSNDAKVIGWQPSGFRDQVASLLRAHVKPIPRYSIRTVRYERKPIQVLRVEGDGRGPYLCDGVVTVRFHGTTRDAEPEEIRALPLGPQQRMGLVDWPHP